MKAVSNSFQVKSWNKKVSIANVKIVHTFYVIPKYNSRNLCFQMTQLRSRYLMLQGASLNNSTYNITRIKWCIYGVKRSIEFEQVEVVFLYSQSIEFSYQNYDSSRPSFETDSIPNPTRNFLNTCKVTNFSFFSLFQVKINAILLKHKC